MSDDSAVNVLLDNIADALDETKSSRDFGEMSPEDAFNDALRAVSCAIREAVDKFKKSCKDKAGGKVDEKN